MPIPSVPSYAQMPNNLSELLKIHRAGYRKFASGLTNLTKVTNLTSKRIGDVAKTANLVKKNANAAKKITDLLKQGKFKSVNPKLGNAIGFALNLASIGLSLLTINQIGNLQEIQLRNDGIVQKDLDIAFQNFVKNTLTIRKLREEYNNFVNQYKLDRDKQGANIYANLQQSNRNRQLSEAAKKQANDALYEAREGRKILDGKITDVRNYFGTELNELVSAIGNRNAELNNRIGDARQLANDALYEARVGRQNLEVQINQKFQSARKIANDALYEVRAGRAKIEANFGSQLNSLRNNLNLELQGVERRTAQQVNNLFANSQTLINNALTQSKNAQLAAKSAQSDAKLAQSQAQVASANITTVQGRLAQIQNSISALKQQVNNPQLNIEPTVQKLITNNPVIQNLLSNLSNTNTRIDGMERFTIPGLNSEINTVNSKTQFLDNRITNLEQNINKPDPAINRLDAQIGGLDARINNQKIALDKLNTRIKEREIVDKNALGKLEQILGIVGPLPLLIGRVPSSTVSQMPKPLTAPQVEAAASAGVCRSTRPGGCMSNALGNTADTINQNTNRMGGNLLDKFNAGANTAQLALLRGIDGKLGPKIGTQGLSGAIKNIFENKIVDRAMQAATLATTIHNALQLSNSLASTLFSATDNILNAIGIKIKDEKGSEIGIQQVVNSLFQNYANSLFGAENVQALNSTFKKANRIYQSGANIVNSVRSMTDSVRNITEFTAENTGKIGNALKTYQVIAPDAYKWMPEQVNGQSIWVQRLQNLEEAASGIKMVSGELLSITQNANEIKQQYDEFQKSVEDLPPKARVDNKPVADSKAAQKAVSTTPAIPEISSDADKEPDV